jgi:hypothetical protein
MRCYVDLHDEVKTILAEHQADSTLPNAVAGDGLAFGDLMKIGYASISDEREGLVHASEQFDTGAFFLVRLQTSQER